MAVKMSIDYGRSTTKAVREGTRDKILYSSWYATAVVDPDVKPEDLKNYNELDYLKVRINGQEFNVGKLAQKSQYCFDGSSDSDIMPDEFEKEELTKAEVNILTAIGLLMEEDKDKEKVNLLTTLPANQFNEIYIKIFKDRLENENFNIEIYDYRQDKYIKKEFYIESLSIKKQGFCAFMHYLLDDNGFIREDREYLMEQTVLVYDIGRYSTDMILIDNMDELSLNNKDLRIKGMDNAFTQIRQEFESEYSFPISKYKVEEYAKKGHTFINGKKEDITGIVKKSYIKFAEQIFQNSKAKLPLDIRSIETCLVCGGGSEPIRQHLCSQLKRGIEEIDNPRFANAIGGLKMLKLSDNLE